MHNDKRWIHNTNATQSNRNRFLVSMLHRIVNPPLLLWLFTSRLFPVQELSLEEGKKITLRYGVSARELRLSAPVGVLGVSVGVVEHDVGVVTGQVGEQPLADQCVLALFGEGLEQILLSETIR